MKLFHNHDGANFQAQCVLAILNSRHIEKSWNPTKEVYEAQPSVGRWENCREQGYVISFRVGFRSPQMNIAFFEHRYSDFICAVEWEQDTINTPNIDTMETGNKVYKTKWDISKIAKCGEYDEMADWIMDRLEAFWVKYSLKETK